MARTALNSDDVKIEQKAPIIQAAALDIGAEEPARDGEVVRADPAVMKQTASDLAFMEEPVMIVLQPSNEKNAPTHYPVWVNGKGAEVFQRGRWETITYLPVGQPLTTKRKYVAVLAGAKFDNIETHHDQPGAEIINNRIVRRTSAVTSFSVLEDKNPKGGAWLAELIRRNF